MSNNEHAPELVQGPDAIQLFRAIGNAAFGKILVMSGTVTLAPMGQEESTQNLEIKIPKAEVVALTDLRASIDYKGLRCGAQDVGSAEGVPIIVEDLAFWRDDTTNKVSVVEGDTDIVNLFNPEAIRAILTKYESIRYKDNMMVRLRNEDETFFHRVCITLVSFEKPVSGGKRLPPQ